MTERDILMCAAALAERQPSAGTAIRAALSFADRYPAARRVLEAAEHRDERVSLAVVLAAHCARKADVARSFRAAAEICGRPS